MLQDKAEDVCFNRVPSSRGTEREKPQGTLLLFQWQVGIIT